MEGKDEGGGGGSKGEVMDVEIKRRRWGRRNEGTSFTVNPSQDLDKILSHLDQRIRQSTTTDTLHSNEDEDAEMREEEAVFVKPDVPSRRLQQRPHSTSTPTPAETLSTSQTVKVARLLGALGRRKGGEVIPQPQRSSVGRMSQEDVECLEPKEEENDSEKVDTKYFSAMFSKPSTRKHKKWEGDGYIIASGRTVTLKDTDGNLMESSFGFELTQEMLEDSKPFRLGSKEVQIQEELPSNPL